MVLRVPLLCVQWKTPDDGQRNSPKHVEFYFKTKFEKLVHLVWFYYKNLSRCTVTWMWNEVSCGLLNVRLLSKDQRFVEQTIFCTVVSTHSRSPYGISGFITTNLLHQNTTVSYPKPDESISHISTLILSLKITISKHSPLLKVALAFVTALRSTNMICPS